MCWDATKQENSRIIKNTKKIEIYVAISRKKLQYTITFKLSPKIPEKKSHKILFTHLPDPLPIFITKIPKKLTTYLLICSD